MIWMLGLEMISFIQRSCLLKKALDVEQLLNLGKAHTVRYEYCSWKKKKAAHCAHCAIWVLFKKMKKKKATNYAIHTKKTTFPENSVSANQERLID